MKSYSFADLFSGCGGLSLGLSLAGLNGKFAIERDPMAFETFSANFIDNASSNVAFDWPNWLAKRAWDIELLLAQHKDDLVIRSAAISARRAFTSRRGPRRLWKRSPPAFWS